MIKYFFISLLSETARHDVLHLFVSIFVYKSHLYIICTTCKILRPHDYFYSPICTGLSQTVHPSMYILFLSRPRLFSLQSPLQSLYPFICPLQFFTPRSSSKIVRLMRITYIVPSFFLSLNRFVVTLNIIITIIILILQSYFSFFVFTMCSSILHRNTNFIRVH